MNNNLDIHFYTNPSVYLAQDFNEEYMANCKYCEKEYKPDYAKLYCSLDCRFWSKVDKKPIDCWEWMGNKYSTGLSYGKFEINSKTLTAHRIAWELTRNKKIPNGKIVMHVCDNASCVQPLHLYLGTRQNNMDDKKLKGRAYYPGHKGVKGEAHHNAKLNREEVLEIKASKLKEKELMKIYNVSKITISRIRNERTWKCL